MQIIVRKKNIPVASHIHITNDSLIMYAMHVYDLSIFSTLEIFPTYMRGYGGKKGAKIV